MSLSTESEYTFKSHLHTLPEVHLQLENPHTDEERVALKKKARLEISIAHANDTRGFLHASLVKINDKYYLLAGPSQVGKSTYSRHLVEKYQGEILAHDWVAVEREGDALYASDLNFEEKLKDYDRCRLDGVFFLTYEDELERDAYAPNQAELQQLLAQTFDTAPEETQAQLQNFWLLNQGTLPLWSAVPTHQKSQDYVADTIVNLIERNKRSNDEIGIVGLGAIGRELAFLLGQMDGITHIHLFNRSPEKAKGYALDMNHAMADRDGIIYQAHEHAEEVFDRSTLIFLCFRGQDGPQLANVPERWRKAPRHIKIMHEYAQLASQQQYDGTVFVLTNPVDLLTYMLHLASQETTHPLRTYQVYGLGLEVDIARAQHYLKQEGVHLPTEQIRAVGNHSDEFTVVTPLSTEENAHLLEKVKGASKEVRQFVDRTVFGPVMAAKRNLEALQKNQMTSLAVLLKKSVVGMPIRFNRGLPMILSSDPVSMDFLETNRASMSNS